MDFNYQLFIFLLQNKKQKTYKRALKMLINVCTQNGINLKRNLKNSSIILDFEQSMITAAKQTFKDMRLKGVSFIWGKIGGVR